MAQIVIQQGPEGARNRETAWRLVTAYFSNADTVLDEAEAIISDGTSSSYRALLALGEVAASMVMLLTDEGEDHLEAIDRLETVINRLNAG